MFLDVRYFGVKISYLRGALEQRTKLTSLQLVEEVAKLIISLFLVRSQRQLNLTNQKRVLEFKIDQYISRRLVQFVLHSDNFKVIFLLEYLIVDSVDLLFRPHTFAS